jgi:hypothetical protein
MSEPVSKKGGPATDAAAILDNENSLWARIPNPSNVSTRQSSSLFLGITGFDIHNNEWQEAPTDFFDTIFPLSLGAS